VVVLFVRGQRAVCDADVLGPLGEAVVGGGEAAGEGDNALSERVVEGGAGDG